MKKNIMLGVNSSTNKCRVLYCLLNFDALRAPEIQSEILASKTTNWCGRDEIKRTLDIIKMKQTGRKIRLYKKITFLGSDFDMGHEYPWKFEIDEIHELEEIK